MAEGFFYHVRALVDKASFEEGRRELDKLAQASKAIISGIAGAAKQLVDTGNIAGRVAQQELQVARAVGASTEAVAGWKNAISAAGASANGLIGSLSSLEVRMQHLKTGSVDHGLAKSLGMLGVGYGDFADMDSESRMRTVFNQAKQMNDQKLAATLVGDVLGSAGRDYYESIRASGKSLEQQLAEGRALSFVSEKNRKDAAKFSAEFGKVREAGKSILQLFGSELARTLTPTMTRVKDYIIQNREKIRKGIAGIAKNVGSTVEMITGAIGKIAPLVEKLINNFGGLDKVIIRVAAGIGALKIMQLAGGIKNLVGGINLLKAGLSGLGKGLVAGGLFLFIDDLMVYFGGKGKSVIGYVIDHLDELKDKFKDMIGEDNFNKIADALKKVEKVIDSIKKSLPELADLWMPIFGDVGQFLLDSLVDGLTGIVDALGWIGDLMDAFSEGGLSGGLDFLKGEATKFMDGLKAANALQKDKEWAATADIMADKGYMNKGYLQTLRDKGDTRAVNMATQMAYDRLGFMEKQKISMQAYLRTMFSPDSDSKMGRAIGIGVKGVKAAGKTGQIIKKNMNDGIVAPDGRVIGISPSDWVFAVKDLSNLATAFAPGAGAGFGVNAPATYTVNQTFMVGSAAKAREVQAYAYRGTSEALRQNLGEAARIMQFMPGMR